MKRFVQFLLITLMLGFFSTTTFSQILMDGESSDWDAYPVLIEAPDNLDGVFPAEVGAIVNDIVDVKTVKAVAMDNVLYFFIEFWGGPAWPNNAYENDHEGTIYYASRGYYHIMLDLDNDVTTGWSTDWYEAHYTTVGYLISQGQPLEAIGAEVMAEWGARTRDMYEVTVDSLDYMRNLDYWAADYEEYDGETDLGSDYEIFNAEIPKMDSTRMMGWHGSAKINSSDDQMLLDDSLRSYWFGHGWGNTFLEFAMEMTLFQKYYMNKDGRSVLQPGDVIGICALIETPIDDWGVDMTTRGEITLPMERPVRPEIITFDGDDSDWADIPVMIEAPDNLDGVFPAEVGAIVNDIVDVKEVKAFLQDDNIFFNIKFWGGPAWPNNAYENDHEGTIYYASRGYYHLMLDLDNDVTTGWTTDWYEAHYTTVGYLISQGQPYETVGAEVMIEWGARTRDAWEVANGADYVRNHDYWGADWEEYDGETDLGSTYDMYNYEVIDGDSATIMGHDGMLLNDPSVTDGRPDWMAHAWGFDFIEVGHSVRAIKNYFTAKDGRSIFNDGDIIGVCALIETPIDDWGVDMTTRGQMTVNADPTAVEPSDLVVNKFSLDNNYPNPFNPTTNIDFTVPTRSEVSLVIYNNLGQRIKTLINNEILSGYQNAVWNGKNDFGNSVPSGVYYYRLESGSNSITKSMVLLK